jgi:hypothetical protein
MKRFAIVISAVLLLAIQAPASAAPLYKCEVGGALAFQDTPCPPVKTKQKVACADADGFAVYQDSLEATCANVPAGTESSNDFSNSNKQKAATTSSSGKSTARKNTASKEIKEVFVRGYTKDDGTKVPSYTRSLPGDKAKELPHSMGKSQW